MFEHLGPLPEIKTKARPTRIKTYLGFLLLAVVLFFVVNAIHSGPNTQAAKPDDPIVLLAVNGEDRQVVVHTPQIAVFSILIKTPQPGFTMRQLRISTKGVFGAEVFDNLKLYQQSTQVGQISTVDREGNIYFDLNHYQLPAGDNELNLILSDGNHLKPGDILQFSLADNTALSLDYQGKLILGQGAFPLLGGTLTVTEKGRLLAHNNSKSLNGDILSKGVSVLTEFSVAANAEQVDLNALRLVITNSDDSDLSTAKFSLRLEQETVATASADSGQLVFSLDKNLVVSPQHPLIFSLLAEGLQKGDYDISLIDAAGRGFVSGQDLNLDKPLALGTIHVQDNFLQFSSLPVDKKLSLGWNLIYNFKVKSVGQAKLAINKLSWQLSLLNLDLAQAKLSVNGRDQSADLIISDDKIIAKTAANQPIEVDQDGLEIQLLVRIDKLNKASRLETYLLPDLAAPGQDILLSNLLWSLDGQMHNGYLLSGLPMSPQVLDY